MSGGGQAPGSFVDGSGHSILSWILFLLTKDLPGYYFDPEKNRYFRLLPGHNNCNPLTKEGIQQKAMEHKRLQLLEEEDRQTKVGSTLRGPPVPRTPASLHARLKAGAHSAPLHTPLSARLGVWC